MKTIDRPDFLSLSGEIASVFAEAGRSSFFNLPEWYDIVAQHGLEASSQPRSKPARSPARM